MSSEIAPLTSKPRMTREARRVQLLEAAQQVFVENGFHSAVMDDIAVRAGVSKPVLYQHFPGKLDLYLALVNQHVDAMLDNIAVAMQSTSKNRDRVAATIEAFFRFIDDDDEAFRLVFESDLTNEPKVRDAVGRFTKRSAAAVAEPIRQDSHTSSEVALLLGYGLVGMAESSARAWLESGRTVPLKQAAEAVSRLAWRGISGFPRAEAN